MPQQLSAYTGPEWKDGQGNPRIDCPKCGYFWSGCICPGKQVDPNINRDAQSTEPDSEKALSGSIDTASGSASYASNRSGTSAVRKERGDKLEPTKSKMPKSPPKKAPERIPALIKPGPTQKKPPSTDSDNESSSSSRRSGNGRRTGGTK